MKRKDGGTAFPTPVHRGMHDRDPVYDPGMSLRDWFAGMALQGMIAAYWEGERGPNADESKTMTRGAYQFADAMLREREKGGRDG